MLKFSRQARLAPRRMRSGLTLVEMLVAMTCTLLMMLAITQTFQNIGEVSAKGRAAIEMSTQLRGVQHRLHKDLESLTVPVRPWPEAGAGEGYFEIVEGNAYDALYASSTNSGESLYGDYDDILAMTIRSTGEPFVGRYVDPVNGPTMIQSQVAEVLWFTSFVDQDGNGAFNPGESFNLHRRVLLVRPDLNLPNTGELQAGANSDMYNFLQRNDLSVRPGSTNLIANSLSDLTQRENRFAHATVFPGAIQTNASGTLGYTDANRTPKGFLLSHFDTTNNPPDLTLGTRAGEDVMLSNVLAMDIRVFDRTATIRSSSDGTEALAPGDPGYESGVTPIGSGAYVDLGYSRYHTSIIGTLATEFSGPSANKAFLGGALVYDTWSYFYEHDGVNQDSALEGMNLIIDEATNGLDDDNQNGIDDVGERETSPPYPVPLRGVQVRIRVLEPETRQVRQATVVKDFIPE
jgi:hypothetical protein